MRKTGIIFLSLLLFGINCFAQSSINETISISTYYSSPQGIYGVLNLFPKSEEPQNPAQGDIYFNEISETVMYYKNEWDKWQNLVGSGGGGGGGAGGIWNETTDHNIHNTNTGQVSIQGNPDANGVLMEVRGDPGLLDPGRNNVFSLVRKFDAAGTYQNTISFTTEGTIDYEIQHLQNPPVLRIVKAPLPGETVLAVKENRVGIGTEDPFVPLHIETSALTSPIIVKTGTGSAYSSGIATITPWLDILYLTFGCYLKNNSWKHDPFIYGGVPNKYNAKFAIRADGAKWYASDNGICSWDLTGGTHVDLWDLSGVWNGAGCPSSSRSLKENFTRLNADDILAKIDSLEVTRWNYMYEDESITHIGPVAEDFNRLFKTGSRENQLHLIDSIGVSLAGVKALAERADVQQQLIEELKAEIKGLKLQLKKHKKARP